MGFHMQVRLVPTGLTVLQQFLFLTGRYWAAGNGMGEWGSGGGVDRPVFSFD